jgi:hypothetical protein
MVMMEGSHPEVAARGELIGTLRPAFPPTPYGSVNTCAELVHSEQPYALQPRMR